MYILGYRLQNYYLCAVGQRLSIISVISSSIVILGLMELHTALQNVLV